MPNIFSKFTPKGFAQEQKRLKPLFEALGVKTWEDAQTAIKKIDSEIGKSIEKNFITDDQIATILKKVGASTNAKIFELSGGKDYKELQPIREALNLNLEIFEGWLHPAVLSEIAKYDKSIADNMALRKKLKEDEVKTLLEKVQAQKSSRNNPTAENTSGNGRSAKAIAIILIVAILLTALILFFIFK